MSSDSSGHNLYNYYCKLINMGTDSLFTTEKSERL